MADAQSWFEKTLAIREALRREADTPQNRRDLSISYNRLGALAQAQNQLADAQSWFEKALAICEALQREADTPQNRRDLSISYHRLGALAQAQNQLAQAQGWFEKSSEICEALQREADTPQAQQDLSATLEKILALKQHTGQTEGLILGQGLWSIQEWDIFQSLWQILSTPQRAELLRSFPQSDAITAVLTQQQSAAAQTRPTIGCIIATACWAKQTSRLYHLIDFAWLQNTATPETLAQEQLGALTYDQHHWGIRWHQPATQRLLAARDDLPEDIVQSLEQGLASSISLQKEEKKAVVQQFQTLSVYQCTELLKIFQEEQFKFCALSPANQTQLTNWAHGMQQDWLALVAEVMGGE